ncbi:hypothetical protein PPL_08951 [Heterostelium album PN500]|uniref:Carrier domain-containing protein n=1 Tax=Heterostelium pallidum (strain ATCC 26659 / Pp 5 / PN500) TaxID=670386 RepID=D3BK70_HETP5|nr:hypothetical protein PPL_08951 [Heterostelium album PN500]EFA78300.1 hypothetical protein PPL_08951 [Heterostelium album PN500]|eukprot:XP_020430425.1 hypothetical protein PPL_08951 [Heterostelium album PN500]
MYKSFISVFKEVVRLYSNINAIEIAKFNKEYVDENSCSKSNSQSSSLLVSHLTFDQLDRLSDLVAQSLINIVNNSNGNNNIKSKKVIVIGVLAQHSYQLIISILAIFKAGYVYLPLDLSFPKERLLYMIENSDCSLIITQHQQHNYFNDCNSSVSDSHHHCIDCLIDNHLDSSLSYNNDNNICFQPLNNNSDDLAYLIYTSGSTGKPKGVEVNHAGIVNFLECQIDAFQMRGNHTRILQSLPVCFDASLSEIGCSLLSGSTLVIAESVEQSAIVRASPKYFFDYLGCNRVTTVMLAPSFISQIQLSEIDSIVPQSLETIVVGGEVCPTSVISDWIKFVRLVSVYGPTEATVCSSLLIFPKSHAVNQQLPNTNSIGNPIANTDIYLVTSQQSRVSVGQVGEEGEIYISGIGVARAYRGLDELTAERFTVDSVTGVKTFRTGDWGRMLSDGTIEFRGRIDNQVKFNGQRIELDEISRSIELYPLVQQAIVDIKQLPNSGDKIMVAYITMKDIPICQANIHNQEYNNNDIKSIVNKFLAVRLPKYMIPSHYVIMKQGFPINSNEKIDRSKLPLPEDISSTTSTNNNSETIESLLQIMLSAVLTTNSIDVNADLISDYGLNSIGSIRFIQLARSHGIHITPIVIYRERTIQRIAKSLQHHHQNDNKSTNTNNNSEVEQSVLNLKKIADQLINNYLTTETTTTLKANSNNSNSSSNNKNSILLTGSTGNLDILKSEEYKDYDIYLLVRNRESAISTIYNQIDYLNDPIANQLKSRVILVTGDLLASENSNSNSYIGIDPSILNDIVKSVTIVIHSAATVHMNYSFQQMVNENVVGLLNLLKLLQQCSQLKQFHYLSTLSVLLSNSDKWCDNSNNNNNNTFVTIYNNESVFQHHDSNIIYGAYAQTKWINEYILETTLSISECRSNNFNTHIHRPAMICSKSPSSTNYLSRLLHSSIAIKCYPSLPQRIHTDITPIDSFIQSFTNNLMKSQLQQQTTNNIQYYLYHNQSISLLNLFKELKTTKNNNNNITTNNNNNNNNELQLPLEMISTSEWKSRIIEQSECIPNMMNFITLLDILDENNDYI